MAQYRDSESDKVVEGFGGGMPQWALVLIIFVVIGVAGYAFFKVF